MMAAADTKQSPAALLRRKAAGALKKIRWNTLVYPAVIAHDGAKSTGIQRDIPIVACGKDFLPRLGILLDTESVLRYKRRTLHNWVLRSDGLQPPQSPSTYLATS